MNQSGEENIDLDALRRGDARAFSQLVARHQALVLSLCQSMGLQGADRDDAAAEVFAAVFRSVARFEGRSALSTWVYRIACRVIPKARQRYRQRGSESPEEDRADPRQTTPYQQSSQRETEHRVWDAVAQLDDRSAMAVELHYRRGMGVEEIGQVLQCPPGTVKTLLFRARAKLKTLLGAVENES